MRVAAIVPAAGKGRRLGKKIPKPFVKIFGKPLLVHTILGLKKAFSFEEIVVAAQPSLKTRLQILLRRYGLSKVRVVAGGSTRSASVKKALEAVSDSCRWVLVHDAARPVCETGMVQRLLSQARKTGAALCALPSTDTLKKVDGRRGLVYGTQDRRTIFLAQTPQAFRKELLLERYRVLGKKAFRATDEASLFDGSIVPVKVVLGSPRNVKVTTPADLELVKFYLRKNR